MSHRNTKVAWDINSKEIVYIGDRNDWKMTGRDKQHRPIWIPKSGAPEKADRGRNHYCCSEKHVPLKVNQGAVNKWSFSAVRSGSSLSSCNLQPLLGDFQNSRGEGPRHKRAKYILAHFLQSPPGKDEFNVKRGFDVISEGIEKQIPGESVIPDITIEHDDGRPDTYVEIVVTSAPHQNPNAWLFYESRQEQLVVIDVKDNQRGWHYQQERILEILVEKFRRYFNDPERTNAPKIWDDRASSHIPISGLVREWVDSHLDDAEREAWEQQVKADKEEEHDKAKKEHEKLERERQSKKAKRKTILDRATKAAEKFDRTNPRTPATRRIISAYHLETILIESWVAFVADFPDSLKKWLDCEIEDKECIDGARDHYQSRRQRITASIRGDITSADIRLDHDMIEDLVIAVEGEVKLLADAYEKRQKERNQDNQAEQDKQDDYDASLKEIREKEGVAASNRRGERRDFGDKATQVTNHCQAITDAASRYEQLITVHAMQNYQALTQVTTARDNALREIKNAIRHSPPQHYVTVKKDVDKHILDIDNVITKAKRAMDYIDSHRTKLEGLAEPPWMASFGILSRPLKAASEHRLPPDYWDADYPDRELDLDTRLAGLSEHTDTIADVTNYVVEWEAGYTDLTRWELPSVGGRIRLHGDDLSTQIRDFGDNAVRLCDNRIGGVLRFFNSLKGFGFILPDDRSQQDHFFHESSIVGDNLETTNFTPGMKVIFTPTNGKKGPVAQRVQKMPLHWDY